MAASKRAEVVTRLREAEPRRFVVYAVFLLIFVFFAATLHDDGFLSYTNLLNIVRQTTPITVMAVAVVFVLSAGEIDLSLGAVVALSALVTADTMQSHSAVLAIAAGLGVGIGVGVVNGLFVTVLVLPSFLVTLASMGVITGLARSITDLQAVAVENQRFVDVFGSGNVGPIPSLAFWALGTVALGHFVFRHRRFGAHVVAVGDNPRAARAAGIRVDRVHLDR
jgi:ribose transport system permease protein